jgi:hypothetical protein
MEISRKFLKTLKIELPYYQLITLLGGGISFSKVIKSGYCRDAYIPMFITVLFMKSKTWN